MLFNTIDFAAFFPIVLVLYWFVFNRNLKFQNIFLIGVSYFFYAFWDWRFLGLICLSSIIDYFVGLQLGKVGGNRKYWLCFSLFTNLGLLGFFKYFNFFIDGFKDVFMLFGQQIQGTTLDILLPVGISFYTFQTLSYTIDVYRSKIEPTKDVLSFFAFVSFFPQLVAGPIERASNLLPQFQIPRQFNYERSVDGLRLILLGLFQKMVIADNCAKAVNNVFDNYESYNGSTLFFGAVFFAFQIYGDFSGYSNIAIGTSRLLGFNLMQNFNSPYLSRNLGEFWRRWHISLSTWFRDYVYIPLGGNKVSKPKWIRNIFVVFLISGFWHGANWTFVVWGMMHAVFFLPLILFGRNEKGSLIADQGKYFPSIKTIMQIGVTFLTVVMAWVFFRVENMSQAYGYFEVLFSESLFMSPQISKGMVLFLFVYMIFEWHQREKKHLFDFDFIPLKSVRYILYYALIFIIFYFAGETQPFIYFQF